MLAHRACVRRLAACDLRPRPRLASADAHSPAAVDKRHASTAASHTKLLSKCPFSILRIEPTKDFSKIKRAFEAAARCHPDVMPASTLSTADPHATAQEFHLITAAFQVLQDPWTRNNLSNSAQVAPVTDQPTPDVQCTTWRRQQQEMEWCVDRHVAY